MKNYKLKKEARQFFDENISEKIKPIEFWINENVLQIGVVASQMFN